MTKTILKTNDTTQINQYRKYQKDKTLFKTQTTTKYKKNKMPKTTYTMTTKPFTTITKNICQKRKSCKQIQQPQKNQKHNENSFNNCKKSKT